MYQSLAISMIGSLAPKELTESLDKDIMNIALKEGRTYTLFIRKKAILCLLRMYRKFKDRYKDKVESWAQPIINMFDQSNFFNIWLFYRGYAARFY